MQWKKFPWEKTLKFFTPMHHWPETMMTYEMNSRTFSPVMLFGGYGSLQGAIFDDECSDFEFTEGISALLCYCCS